jgi:hypothetical protein
MKNLNLKFESRKWHLQHSETRIPENPEFRAPEYACSQVVL